MKYLFVEWKKKFYSFIPNRWLICGNNVVFGGFGANAMVFMSVSGGCALWNGKEEVISEDYSTVELKKCYEL